MEKNPSIGYQFYEKESDPQSTNVETEDAPYYSLANIYDAQLKNKKSRTTQKNKIIEFCTWLEDRRARGLYGPTAEELRATTDKSKFFQIVAYYFEYRFNITYNKPNSFNTDLTAIKHWLLTKVKFATSNALHFPWFANFKRGVRNIGIHALGQDGPKPKLAIFNPMLEKMLKNVTEVYIFVALLLAHRFCLRAQHYLKTDSGADFVKLKSLKFRHNADGSMHSMSIYNKRDKNHASAYEMHRTVYCSCDTPWTCLPCYAYWVYKTRIDNGADMNEPFIMNNGKHMTYDYMQRKIKKLLEKLGVDPSSYGTHSLRAGGTTEMYLAGYNIIEIRNFVWWRTLESVLGYIRPHNPDMEKFVPDFEAYCKSRRNKSAIFADNDEVILAILEKKCKSKARNRNINL